MTYNEWRDELKNNLLTVTDAERRRVLDYYAEAYADRREAGFSEREIIDGFGAPYDAAQRILFENSDDYYRQEPGHREVRQETDRRNYTSHDEAPREERAKCGEHRYTEHEQRRKEHKERLDSNGGSALFVLLCIILAIPTFAIVMAMIGITIGLCIAPFSVVVSGAATIGAGIGSMFGNLMVGVLTLGEGIIILGVGIMLFPLCIWLAKLMWRLFKMFFKWLKQLCNGREIAQ